MSRPALSAWRMGLALILLPFVIGILMLGTGTADSPPPAATASPAPPSVPTTIAHWPPLNWWDWGVNRTITAPEREALLKTGCHAIYTLGGSLSRVSGVITWIPQGRPHDAPAGFPMHLVVRIDADIGRSLDDGNTKLLVDLLVAGYQRNRTPATMGLQLDCDVPTKRLPSYATLLHALRQRLPDHTALSVTMLLDWTHNRSGLTALGREVDCVVPQFYSALVPLSADSVDVSFAGGWISAIQRLEDSGLTYLIGLPTFMQCSLFAPSGDLLHASVPLSPAAALAAGGVLIRAMHQDQITIEIDFPQQVQLAGEVVQPRSRALFGQLSVAGLGHLLAQLRQEAPAHCTGVCLFHLPGFETTQSLSIAQVAVADTGQVRPATISARLESQHDGMWTLIIRNPGDEDWLDLASPARVILTAHGAPITLNKEQLANPAVVRISGAGNDQGDAAVASTSWYIDIGMLRAADVISIEDVIIPTGAMPLAQVVNANRPLPAATPSR